MEELDARIEGANITVRELKGINNVVRSFLSVIEIPLFGGVILTIIGVGEANFFSPQVLYMTEPMASIGKESKEIQGPDANIVHRPMVSHSWNLASWAGVLVSIVVDRR